MKTLKNKLSYALCVLSIFVLCVGCNQTSPKTIKEQSVVEKVSKGTSEPNMKYWVVTEGYNFFTNTLYNVGDTVRLTKNVN
jgi:hypothetical protein